VVIRYLWNRPCARPLEFALEFLFSQIEKIDLAPWENSWLFVAKLLQIWDVAEEANWKGLGV